MTRAPCDWSVAPLKERRRRCGIAARKPERDSGAGRVGLCIEAGKELLGLVQTALEHSDLSKAGGRVDAS